MSDNEDTSQLVPKYFEFLDINDQETYNRMRSEFMTSEHKYNRGKRVEHFETCLLEIRKFCIRGDQNDWKRFLVCGICWCPSLLAVNTRQLRLLLDKCKSSINGALSKMGYSTTTIKGECSNELLNAIPFLRGNYVEQRQWSIRSRSPMSPQPSSAIQNQFPIYEPYLPPPPKPLSGRIVTMKDEILQLFGAIDGKVVDGKECIPQYLFIDNKFNFFTDPICCCPTEWICEVSSPEEMTTFG